ncbi:hypothetical protein FOMA001_g3881 [Fusarium oxysporum f. sp. matthiolae]|nr:hypothetical protein FOMA001_g3881 [Fusarium oxysporum f. sp. matthiolae]
MPLSAETKGKGSWIPLRRKPECPLDISIDRHFQAKAYTSGSTVTGCVTLAPQVDLTFESFEVLFKGTASTMIQLLNQGSMPKSSHRFLQLKMPSAEASLPNSRTLREGHTYTVPFSFIIPYQLPSAACKHRSLLIRERHLQLPPSTGTWAYEDLTIQSLSVQYAVEARVILRTEKKGKQITLERCHSIKLMPFLPEQPPLHTSPGNSRYILTQEGSIRKDMLSSKLGYLKATTSQPDPVIISAGSLQPSSCSTVIDLEFRPTSHKSTPPQIYAKSASIQASTYYSTGHIGFLPDQHTYPSVVPNPILCFVLKEGAVVNESQQSVWEQQPASAPAGSSQGDSGNLSHNDEPHQLSSRSDLAETGSPRYTATLNLSITLPGPDKKILLPTFHSCLISRTYILEIVLATGSHLSSMALRLPIQIAVEGCHRTVAQGIPTYEQVQAEQGLGDLLPTYEHAA